MAARRPTPKRAAPRATAARSKPVAESPKETTAPAEEKPAQAELSQAEVDELRRQLAEAREQAAEAKELREKYEPKRRKKEKRPTWRELVEAGDPQRARVVWDDGRTNDALLGTPYADEETALLILQPTRFGPDRAPVGIGEMVKIGDISLIGQFLSPVAMPLSFAFALRHASILPDDTRTPDGVIALPLNARYEELPGGGTRAKNAEEIASFIRDFRSRPVVWLDPTEAEIAELEQAQIEQYRRAEASALQTREQERRTRAAAA